jgi:hypothetical protein
MKKKFAKKIVGGTVSVVLFLFAVLCIHLYIVTRPKAPDASTIAMARINFKQSISKDDAATISAWLYKQPGVDHVLCNPASSIAVFTFYPVKTNADKVINNFKAATAYKAERYMPTEEEMQKGCPAMGNSFSNKLYHFFKNL